MDSCLARAKLSAAVGRAMDRASEKPAEYGIDDCAPWAVTPLYDVFGIDAFEDYRGRYDSKDGGKQLVGALGLGFLLRRAAKKYGWRKIIAAEAKAGDIGLALVHMTGHGSEPVVMVCRDTGWFVCRNQHGYTALPDSKIRLAWAVA